MAFMIPNAHQSFSEAEKLNLNHPDDKDTQISRQLYLKSSSAQASSKTLDKDVILKRIRHRKNLNKVRNAFHALERSLVSANQQKWLDPDDAFSSP